MENKLTGSSSVVGDVGMSTVPVVKVFPGVGRGFHDPGEAKIYKPEVAKEAWTLSIQHLDVWAAGAR